MTCIAAIAKDNKVYMAGDRSASDMDVIIPMAKPKIMKSGLYVIGYAGSVGTGQMAHCINLPNPDNINGVHKFLRTKFVKALRSSISDFDVDVTSEDKASASYIVGIYGRVFEIDSTDWQVVEYDEVAIGSGMQFAFGSLHATKQWKDPKKRVTAAVQAACDLSPTCLGPVDFLEN